MNRVRTFFQEGVFETVKSILGPKPRGALIASAGYLVMPTAQSRMLFRTVVHESAHAIEAKTHGAKVDRVSINYQPTHFLGQTQISNTTPQSATHISVAGLGADLGFILGSTLLRRISIKIALLWLVMDAATFLFGKDYTIYQRAKKHIERGKVTHE